MKSLRKLALGFRQFPAAGALHERPAHDRRRESHDRDLPCARAVKGHRSDTESAEQDSADEKHEPEEHQDELANGGHGPGM